MKTELLNKKVAIIGSGQMGEVLTGSLCDLNLAPENIICCDINTERLESIAKKYGVKTSLTSHQPVENADIIILAVKPQVMGDVLREISGSLRDDHTLISLAAGITINYLKERIKHRPAIIRVMPNTPLLVKKGISAIAINQNGHNYEEMKALAELIFGSVGEVIFVEENLMDAVTGLSGSGPAYIYLIIEALSDAGVLAGLPRRIADKLAINTVLGAAHMVHETNLHPALLKEMVTSPGGTTIAGLNVLERSGIRGILMDTVLAAVHRAKELGLKNGDNSPK